MDCKNRAQGCKVSAKIIAMIKETGLCRSNPHPDGRFGPLCVPGRAKRDLERPVWAPGGGFSRSTGPEPDIGGQYRVIGRLVGPVGAFSALGGEKGETSMICCIQDLKIRTICAPLGQESLRGSSRLMRTLHAVHLDQGFLIMGVRFAGVVPYFGCLARQCLAR